MKTRKIVLEVVMGTAALATGGLLCALLFGVAGCYSDDDHPHPAKPEIQSVTVTVTTAPTDVVPKMGYKEVLERQKLFVDFSASEVAFFPSLEQVFIVRDTNGAVWYATFAKDKLAITEKILLFKAMPKAVELVEIPQDPDDYALEHGLLTNNPALDKAFRDASVTNKDENP